MTNIYFFPLLCYIMYGRYKKSTRKKIRSRHKYTSIQKQLQQHKKWIKLTSILFAVCLFFIAVFFLLRITLFSSKNAIQRVIFSPESILTYDDPEIYNQIEKFVIGRNFYLLKRNHLDELQKNIQENYPIVESILIEQSGEKRVYISIWFHEPTLVFRSPSRFTAVYDETLYPLISWNILGENTLTIDIPRYTSWYNSLHGILYAMNEDELKKYITTIQETLGSQHISEIIYLPWWMKLFITYKWKKVYFHLDQEVNRQLAKLVDMENWYWDFENIRTIDLWSIDDIIVR